MPEPIAVEDRVVAGGTIRILRFDRPEARHAMDTAMLIALVEQLDVAARADDVLGLLLAGSGGTFSAGADVREHLADGGARRMELFATFYESLSTHPLPTAAAIEGAAVGGGTEAAATCDIRVAGRSALVRFPGAIYSIPVGAARTTGLVGLGTAKDWVLSSRDVGAEEALRTGFLQRVVDDGQAELVAMAWLELVASRQTTTVARLKRALNDFAGLPDRVAWENDALRALHEGGAAQDDLRPGAFGMPRRAQRR